MIDRREKDGHRTTPHHTNDTGATSLRALIRFMELRGLKAGPLAQKAGFSPSAIYNLTAGRAREPSMGLLQKIAVAEGVTVADIMAYGNDHEMIEAAHVVVSGGRVMSSHTRQMVSRPTTIDPKMPVSAAVVSGDSLFPVPASWIVYFASQPEELDKLVGELSVVYVEDARDALVGTITPSATAGRWDLQPWHGPVIRGLSVIAAHRVVSLQPPAAITRPPVPSSE